MHDDRNTVSSNNRFEILKELTAWTLALLSVAIYPVVIHATAETNRKKGIHYPLGIELRDIASGVLINLLLNKFAAKESINNDILLYQQKEFRQLLTVTLVALICAAGQAFIAYCDADGNLKLPSAFATEVGIAVLSALSLAQLEKLDWLLKERKIAGWYNEFLAPYGDLIQVPRVHPLNTHTWFVYVVCIKNLPGGKAGKKVNRDKVIERLTKIGVSAKPYLPSIHLLSFYRKTFGFKQGDFPACESVSNSAVALPFYIGLKRADIEYISKTLAEVVKKYAKRV